MKRFSLSVCAVLFGCLLHQSAYAKIALSSELEPPIGLRPCCAFGVDLKVDLFGAPIPFFSLDNVVELSALTAHRYNDESEGVLNQLWGNSDESNGLVYTHQGGFIDIAHVRDTVDYTYYLYQKIWPLLGTNYDLVLPDELRQRVIRLYAAPEVLTLTQRQDHSRQLAGVLAFRLAQWHEIAQWFGFSSVFGFPEYPSAFSPEDLYSNLLGAQLAMQVLEKHRTVSVADFSKHLSRQLQDTLLELGAVDQRETKAKIRQLDGVWWDSKTRLPDKWALLKRDYALRDMIQPNGIEYGKTLSLDQTFDQWGELFLVESIPVRAFDILPEQLMRNSHWRYKDMMKLALFAQQQDQKIQLNPNLNTADIL